MATVLIAGAPTQPSLYRDLVAGASRVVVVDGGADVCAALGRVPDLAIGDFDSATDDAMRFLKNACVEILRYSSDKDESDLDLALDEIKVRGWGPVTIACATGGRLDHTLAVLGSIASRTDIVHELWERDLRAWPLDARVRSFLELEGTDAIVSVLVLGDSATVTCSGMRYVLDHDVLESLGSRGLSNVIDARSARISVAAGKILVITVRAEGTPLARATG
ncbi:MAG: thiamine diphosphokinase [Coriobacteriia bacterium]|nr:thiamine diphosphokinase [Coriobacteriia bacterium]